MNERLEGKQLKDNSQDAWEEFFRENYNFAVSIASSVNAYESPAIDPEDIVQQVLLKLWCAREKIDEENGNVKALLAISVHNMAIDTHRYNSLRPSESLEALLERKAAYDLIRNGFSSSYDENPLLRSEQPSIEDVVLQNEIADRIDDAIHALPEPQQLVMRLQQLGFTNSETAGMTRSPMGTVKTRTRLARISMYGHLVDLREPSHPVPEAQRFSSK